MPHYIKSTASTLFHNKNNWTVPNFLSLLRLLLIPVIVILYTNGHPHWAALTFGLSSLTDVLDGWIARKFHQVSDLGKILDPLADKLTQAAVIFCLILRFGLPVAILAGFFVFKEIVQALIGYYATSRSKVVKSANWYGKASSFTLFVVISLLLVFPDWMTAHPMVPTILCCVAGAMLLLALIMYIRFFLQLAHNTSQENHNP